MSWSVDEFTLNEVKDFEFPCVVKITEGYDAGEEIDSFSRDDIIKLDEYVVMQKVVANFVEDFSKRWEHKSDGRDEINIPLNYKGKLNVINDLKMCKSIAELAVNPPRFVKLYDDVRVPLAYKGGGKVIRKGTTMEIDRVMPAMPAVNNNPATETSLVVIIPRKFGDTETVQLPVSLKGKFRPEPDPTEYTLKEVVDRFHFPQIISFLDDSVKEVFERSLRSGVENTSTITGTLRLKKLVHQEVLIGHYKGLDYSDEDPNSQFVRRSVVVIPLSTFSDTTVQVLQEENPQDYELFLLANFSQSEGMKLVDGALYAEFTRKPMMFKFPSEQEEPVRPRQEGPPPARPPKPKKLREPPPIKPKPNLKEVKTDDGDDYEPVSGAYIGLIKSSKEPKTPDQGLSFSIAEAYSDTYSPKGASGGKSYENFKKPGQLTNKIKILGVKVGEKVTNAFVKKKADFQVSKGHPSLEESIKEESDEDSDHIYDEPDDVQELSASAKKVHEGKKNNTKLKPTAKVQPVSKQSKTTKAAKQLAELSIPELRERLLVCGFKPEFANTCCSEKLDGKFLVEMTDDVLKNEPFLLSPLEMSKLDKMKTSNWIPNKG